MILSARQPASSRIPGKDCSYELGNALINVFDGAGTFTTEVQRAAAVERIYHIFKVLWPEIERQQHLPQLLRYAVLTFLENPSTTLPDMIEFFNPKDASYRHKLLARVNDPTIRDYFHNEFDELKEEAKRTRTQPLMNRLHSLFTGNSLVRNIFGSPGNSINFRKAIEQHEIMLFMLPTTDMMEIARLLGTIIVAQISAAVFSFVDTPEIERPYTYVFADEGQYWTTEDFKRIYTEARKFRAMFCIAHQLRDQLPEYLENATLGAQIKYVFRSAAPEAKRLAEVFPQPPATVDKVDTHVCKRLLDQASDYPAEVRDFVSLYLKPVKRMTSSGKIKYESWLTKPFIDIGQKARARTNAAYVEEDDPIPELDTLLYEVMQQKKPDLDIPYLVAIGFSFCGRGFHIGLKLMYRKRLQVGVQIPPHLVFNGKWARPPESGSEQLWHFIWHLRRMMAYLARHPIGTSNTPNTNAVAQWITTLKRRTAYVSVGHQAATIMTFDTPKPLTGAALVARVADVETRTRAKYCRPRPEPPSGAGVVPDETPPGFDSDMTLVVTRKPRKQLATLPLSGWGEADQP